MTVNLHIELPRTSWRINKIITLKLVQINEINLFNVAKNKRFSVRARESLLFFFFFHVLLSITIASTSCFTHALYHHHSTSHYSQPPITTRATCLRKMIKIEYLNPTQNTRESFLLCDQSLILRENVLKKEKFLLFERKFDIIAIKLGGKRLKCR